MDVKKGMLSWIAVLGLLCSGCAAVSSPTSSDAPSPVQSTAAMTVVTTETVPLPTVGTTTETTTHAVATKKLPTTAETTVSTAVRVVETIAKPPTTPTAAPTEPPRLNKELTPVSPAQYYGRQQLEKESNPFLLKAYLAVAAAVEAVEPSVYLQEYSLTPKEVRRVIQYYVDDYPQSWFLKSDRFEYVFQRDTHNIVGQLNLFYGFSPSGVRTAAVSMNEAAAVLLKDLTADMPAFERERLIHDRLIAHVDYDQTLEGTNIHNAYGALLNKRAVCDGYARAFQYLLYQAGIPCLIASGVGTNGGGQENHAWNVVQLDGQYYQVDVTWDDPVMESPQLRMCTHAYFNLTTAEMGKNHRFIRQTDTSDAYPISYELPNCSATAENYFVKNRLVFSAWEKDRVTDAVVLAANAGLPYAEVRLAMNEQSFLSALFQNAQSIAAAANKKGIVSQNRLPTEDFSVGYISADENGVLLFGIFKK